MSGLTGDKSRYNRQRKQKLARRLKAADKAVQPKAKSQAPKAKS
jgi:hypothetical protein